VITVKSRYIGDQTIPHFRIIRSQDMELRFLIHLLHRLCSRPALGKDVLKNAKSPTSLQEKFLPVPALVH